MIAALTHVALCAALSVASSLTLAQAPVAEGEVVRIDRAQSRITLRHGEIRHLDMPPMTMTYRVAAGLPLEGIGAGDRVRFSADRVDGSYTVTRLVRAP